MTLSPASSTRFSIKVRRRSGARCPLINIQVGARPAARTDSPPGVTQTYQGKVPLCSSRCSCLQTTPLPMLGKTGPRKQSLQPIMLDLLVSREGFQHQKQPRLGMNAASALHGSALQSTKHQLQLREHLLCRTP